jgi:F-type H+-transporting ATPase subunit a
VDFPPISHLLVWPDILFKDTPLGVNKTVLLMWLAVALTAVIFIVGGRRRSLVPTTFLQNSAEMGVEFVEREIVLSTMGPGGLGWVPLLTAMFFFIFFLNIFEIIPGIQFPVTSRMAIPMYLALQTWALMIYVGFRHHGFKYLKYSLFPPGVPVALKPLLALIELLSIFILRPFTLMIRLFANLLAGHLLLVTFFLMTAAMWVKGFQILMLPLPLAFAIFITVFEILVSVLQAYIFTILTAVYIGESLHGEH